MMLCKDCGVDTELEYYMIHDYLWKIANNKHEDGFLCVGCIEERLGRQLNKKDFTDYPINDINSWKKSERLKSRLIDNG
jgi:hypothetical protein